MLNWRIEEEEYVNNEIDKYVKNRTKLQLLLTSKKQQQKNIEYISELARQRYREKKLDTYFEEVKEERKRINKLVNNLNNKFAEYISNQQHIISKNIKPFKVEAKPYDNFSESTLSQLEVVTIHCEPLKLSFMQEKI